MSLTTDHWSRGRVREVVRGRVREKVREVFRKEVKAVVGCGQGGGH